MVLDSGRLPGQTTGQRAADFWADFAAIHYQRAPFEADKPPVSLPVGPAEMFRLLLRACRGRGRSPADPDVRFYAGQRTVRHDLDDYLPAEADESVRGYLARLERQLDGEPYCLTIRRLHATSRWIWKQAAQFLAPLYEATGTLPGDAEVVAFVGRYPFTTSGIHREQSGVFVWMIEGAKDMLVWPPEAGPDLPRHSARYHKAVASAQRLRCAPGRLVYWPSFYWHIGESPAAPSVGLHLCLVEPPPRPGSLLAAVLAEPQPDGPEDGGLYWPGTAARDIGLPAEYQAAAELARESAGIGDRLTASWLRRRTGMGFTVPPPRFPTAPLDHSDIVTRDSVHPILLAPRDATSSWCSADGRVAKVRTAPALTQLIGLLNAGQPVPVAEALKPASTPQERDLLSQALAMLAGWRALTVTRQSPAS